MWYEERVSFIDTNEIGHTVSAHSFPQSGQENWIYIFTDDKTLSSLNYLKM